MNTAAQEKFALINSNWLFRLYWSLRLSKLFLLLTPCLDSSVDGVSFPCFLQLPFAPQIHERLTLLSNWISYSFIEDGCLYRRLNLTVEFLNLLHQLIITSALLWLFNRSKAHSTLSSNTKVVASPLEQQTNFWWTQKEVELLLHVCNHSFFSFSNRLSGHLWTNWVKALSCRASIIHPHV